VSYFEADAYARWHGLRLPTEHEWEHTAAGGPVRGNFQEAGVFHPVPRPATGGAQMFGDVWEWTQSAYAPYPGYRTAPGAVGEYNGKFMVNQLVLRGGSCVTPQSHIRVSYRNFSSPGFGWRTTPDGRRRLLEPAEQGASSCAIGSKSTWTSTHV
jgi:formylglycine-generating enzyme required for sulfatase activity